MNPIEKTGNRKYALDKDICKWSSVLGHTVIVVRDSTDGTRSAGLCACDIRSAREYCAEERNKNAHPRAYKKHGKGWMDITDICIPGQAVEEGRVTP